MGTAAPACASLGRIEYSATTIFARKDLQFLPLLHLYRFGRISGISYSTYYTVKLMAPARRLTSRTMKPKAQREVKLRVQVNLGADVPTYYVNHAEIGFSRHEFAMWLARMPAKLSPEDLAIAAQAGQYLVAPEAQFILPPTIIAPLIKALQQSLDDYQSKFGTISAGGRDE